MYVEMTGNSENKFMGRRLANAWLSSVTSITLVLLLVGISALLMVSADTVSTYFRENLKISVMLHEEIQEQKARDVQKRLEKMPQVKSTEFISREQGIEELSKILGPDFLTVFDSAPVPLSIDVTMTAETVSLGKVDEVRRQIEALPEVDEVVYQKSLVDALNSNLSKISVALGALIILLVAVSLVLISNTVRLNVYARRFTIRTMSLVGATRHFIRKPFMAQGFFQGVFSSLLAILLLVGILLLVKSSLPALQSVFSLDVLLKVMGIILASGVLLCLASTLFVLNKLLRSRADDLYY